jgi:hypothetical protein
MMRVTFDTQAWNRLVFPERYTDSPNHEDMVKMNDAGGWEAMEQCTDLRIGMTAGLVRIRLRFGVVAVRHERRHLGTPQPVELSWMTPLGPPFRRFWCDSSHPALDCS